MTKIKRCYKGKPLDNINLKSGDSYHQGVENISNLLAGEDLPEDIFLEFEDDEDCSPKQETIGCDDCRKDPDYVYCGKDLPAIGVYNGDSFEDIFEAINNAIRECICAECEASTVLVKYEDGTEIEFVTLQAGEHAEVIVPNCIPSTVEIYNSEGVLLGTILVEQGQSIEYTTPDSTAEIRYNDGTLITTVNIPSGQTEVIYIPNCEPTITNIVDGLGNPLGDVVLNAGEQGTFECPNATVTVENSLGDNIGSTTVNSGGSGTVVVGDTNLIVEYADGTPIETVSVPSSSDDITIVIPNCEDVQVILENTLGNEITDGTYPSGSSNILVAPNALYVLLDEDGTPISSGSIPSNETANITAPNANYTLQNTVPNTISTGSIVSDGNGVIIAPDASYTLVDSAGDPISSGSGSIPSNETINITAPDATYTLQNTALTTLSTGSIVSDGSDTIIAPDANVDIEDQDGNPLGSGTALSGATTVISVNVPKPSGWHRPIEWISQPTIADENVVWELMAVYVGDQNPYTHNLQASGGVTTEFYTDKDAPTPFYTATSNDNTLIDYNDCDPSTEFRGYRQCWVKSFPTNPASNWGGVDFVTSHDVYGSYASQILERLISCKISTMTIYSNHRMGYVIAYPNMLENVEYHNRMPFVGLYGWLSEAVKLRRVWSDEVVTISGGSMREAFLNCGLMTPPENISYNDDNSYQCFVNSNLETIDYTFTNTAGTQYLEFHNAKANRIIGRNMGACTQPIGNITSNSIYWVELHGYTIGHALNGNSMRGEQVFEAWVDSLGNASGSQNITVSTIQYNSFGGLGSYVDIEVASKGYTLMVV